MKQKIVAGSLVLMFLIFFLNISFVPPVSAVPIPNPNTYTYYRSTDDPGPLDPARNYIRTGWGVNELVYESLVDYSGNSSDNIVGELATSWSVSGDGLQYIFSLRDDVYFHDGVHFNAYVMKYSIDRGVLLRDPFGPISVILPDQILGSATYNSYSNANVTQALSYLGVGGVTVVNDFTLEINLTNSDAAFLRILATPSLSAISPKAVIENIPVSYTTNVNDDDFGMVPLDSWFSGLSDWTKLGLPVSHNPAISGVVPGLDTSIGNQHIWMETHSVGTGPYKLVNITNSIDLRFEQNTGWWGDFHANAPDVILNLGELNVDERINLLLNASADQILLNSDRFSDFIYPNGSLIYPFTNVFIIPSLIINFLGFNMFDTISTTYLQEDVSSTYNGFDTPRYSTGTENATKGNPFTSLLFRQAFATAFDYQTLVNTDLNGYAERLEGLVPNGVFGHIDDLIDNGYIPNYSPSTAQSLFTQVGWRGNITVLYNTGNAIRENIGLNLKNTIESLNVGININVTGLPFPTYLSVRFSNQNPIYINGWAPDYSDPNNFLHDGFENFFAPRMNYSNPTTFNYINQQAIETNEIIRSAQIRVAEEQLAQDYAVTYLYQPQDSFVLRDWIQGFPESGSFNPISSLPNYQFIGKPGEWPTVTTVTETETNTVTATITETITQTVTATTTETQITTTVETTTVPAGTETQTVTFPVTITDTISQTATETVTVTVTISDVVNISTTNGGFEVLTILGTIGVVGVLLKRRDK
ncbi:MAG: ABC transporter substrate-binding protein [Candidatus Hodarchaeales archaeon]